MSDITNPISQASLKKLREFKLSGIIRTDSVSV